MFDDVVTRPSMVFLFSMQIKPLICAPVHLPVRYTQTGGRVDDSLRSNYV